MKIWLVKVIQFSWTAYAAVFLIAMILYTAHNDFPPFYHPDERVKIIFAQGSHTKTNHPLLLMGTSRCVTGLLHLKGDESVVRAGRSVSAAFAALAVVALMAMAFSLRGIAAAWIVGILTASSPFLLALAHYMKEDTALLLGFGVFAWALCNFWKRPSAKAIGFLGAASALALSGKYIGIIAPLIALPVLACHLWARREMRWKSLCAFCISFLAVLVTANLYFIFYPRIFIDGIFFEMDHLQNGHLGMVSVFRFTALFSILWQKSTFPVLALSALYLFLFGASFRRRSAAEWFMLLFPVGYFLMLTLPRILSSRYMLPVVVWLHYLAAMAIFEIARASGRSSFKRSVTGVFLLMLALWPQALRSRDCLRQFGNDNRRRLVVWAADNLPSSARVLEDTYTHLNSFKQWNGFDGKMPFTVTSFFWAGDYGTLDHARDTGITHVAICSTSFQRFFSKYNKPGPAGEAAFNLKKQFYLDLAREGKLVWKADTKCIAGGYISPRIYVFQIDGKKRTKTERFSIPLRNDREVD